MIKKLIWMTCALLVFIACAKGEKENISQNVKSNIIYILADDLGYGDLGCYGQTTIETPNLDKLAAEGMMFTQHYSGSTVCAPSRCSLMTGFHTGHSKIRGNSDVPLNNADTTVATLLKSAGYKTGLIGKWGLGEAGSTGIPNKQGFDYFFGYLNQIRAHNYYPDYLWRNRNKVALENEIVVSDTGYSKGIGSASENKIDYSHDIFTAEALDFVEKSAVTPFFLYLAYTIAHANNEYWLVEEHGMEVPDYGIYADKDWPEQQKGLAAMITRMDRDIGSIKKKLEELGIDKNTLIIFSSDNGPHAEGKNNPQFFNSYGELRGIKRDLYEGGIRVPMIAYWPETIQPGQTSKHISAFWDILPTACNIAGINAPKDIDGISFLPELLGNEQGVHEHLYWEFHEQGGKQALRKGQWKLVILDIFDDSKTKLELYNLNDDPAEKNDLSQNHPEIIAEMKAIIENEHVRSEVFPFKNEN